MFNPYPSLSGLFVLAGLSKLIGSRSYRKLVTDLNWDTEQMLQVGWAEVLGGLLLLPRPTRRLGGILLAVTSTTVLLRELQRDNIGLALPRAGLLVGAIGAVLKP